MRKWFTNIIFPKQLINSESNTSSMCQDIKVNSKPNAFYKGSNNSTIEKICCSVWNYLITIVAPRRSPEFMILIGYFKMMVR